MKLTNWFSSSIAEALGWTLIHALWQGFAVVLIIAVFLHLARRGRAALRYQIGMSGLFLQVLASLGTFAWYYEPRSLAGPALAAPSINNVPTPLLTAANESWLVGMQSFLHAHLAEVVWLWLIGVGVFGIRLAGGWAYVQRLRMAATLPIPPTLSAATARISQSMNVSARVQVTARLTGPLVVGMVKPVVLWPIGLLAGLSTADIEAILAHELAHVQRNDYLLNMVQSTIEALYFFHPALWWLSARVREEREHCCDDLAVSIIGDARVLARALANVEEWQRGLAPAPSLAMAFASKRQLLLQRVRRILGVPTSPLVSNGSLVGLTLFTTLLVSVSVYAIQPVNQPKPARAAWPKPTRRHSVSTDSEYGMIDSRRIGYVIWKGQKLTAARVATLQRQLDLVMAGNLSLDVVKQPNRDILLTIIEKNVAFDAGMKALSEGMAQIDYSTIDLSATANVPATPEPPTVDVPDPAPALASDTSRLRAVQQQLELLTKQMKELMAERQPMADKLTREMAELAAKNGDYQKQMSPYTSQIGQLAKQQRALAAKMVTLHRETQMLSSQNSAKAKSLLQQKEAQAGRLEKQLDELDAQMAKLDAKLEPLNARLEPYQNRLEMLADSIEKLYEPTNALSEKIGELSEQFSEQAEKQAEEAMRQAEEITSGKHHVIKGDGIYYFPSARSPRPARPARPPRPPRPAKAPKAPRPAADIPAIPGVSAPPPAPVPAILPKPATAPKEPR
ncbi:M56 family metallopeptidase [Fibrella forsythiae]|uniref:M48 family metalloprotease n=1 Tax=Fibrella forsythiae TaxID=2817061 RepID=A0ABS3JHC3_9BACT|nr:M56 family metallopeptidase [Fibrella forsythiae]MBO0949370.1 M48 family metalloprotease [Fibrella forsythiae]